MLSDRNTTLSVKYAFNYTMDVGDEGVEWIDVNPNGPLEVPESGCRDTFKEGRRFLDMTWRCHRCGARIKCAM